jgi:aminocarboxymuconate-semialdehyde decarboxylase
LESTFEVDRDSTGVKIFKDRGARILGITHQMSDPAERIREMDGAGVDVQVLSLSSPNVYFAADEHNLRLARMTNDYLSTLRDEYPDRFMCLASVPLCNVQDAIEELHRAIDELGMNGLIIGSNIKGKPLNSPEFMPFFEEVNELGLAVLVHPMSPAGVEVMYEFGLAPLIGFVFDTTMAITRMVYSGMMERFRSIAFIVAHLGGAIPYLFERINNGYRAFPDCRENISIMPGEYLKRLYYDTVSFHEPALMCGYQTVGADHMVLGSDYPHVIGSIDESVSSIEQLQLTQEEKEMIFGGNAMQILRHNDGEK